VQAAPAIKMKYSEIITIFKTTLDTFSMLDSNTSYLNFVSWFQGIESACIICDDDFNFSDILTNNNGSLAQKTMLFNVLKIFVNGQSALKAYFDLPSLLNEPFLLMEKIKEFFANVRTRQMNDLFNRSKFTKGDDILKFCNNIFVSGKSLDFTEVQICDKIYDLLKTHQAFDYALNNYLNNKNTVTYDILVTSLLNSHNHLLSQSFI